MSDFLKNVFRKLTDIFISIVCRISVRNGDNFQSTKENKDGHGMGLANVRQAVDRYGGEMKTDYSEEEFYVGILLYI